MNERVYADLTANGTSDWVSLRGGGFVSVDCVNVTTGETASFDGATATLVYSPVEKMVCAVRNSALTAITGTDGFCWDMPETDGFVAIVVSSYSSGKFRICVTKAPQKLN